MSDQLIILITGATAGLGRLTAKKCIDLGHTVIITGRSQASLDTAKEFILKDSPQSKDRLYQLIFDLVELDTVKRAVEEDLKKFDLPCIDVIVHNAGCHQGSFQQVHNVEQTIFANAIGPFYLNRLLLPFIKKSANPRKRILFVGSSLHDSTNLGAGKSEAKSIPHSVNVDGLFDGSENGSEWDGMKYYKLSKLALVWGTYSLCQRSPDIPIVIFCPGFVPSTNLARNGSFILRLAMKFVLPFFSFARSEEDSTDDYIFYITTDTLESGKHYQNKLVTDSSVDSMNKVKQEAFWQHANKTIDNIVNQS